MARYLDDTRTTTRYGAWTGGTPKVEHTDTEEGVLLDPGSEIQLTDHLTRSAIEAGRWGAPDFRVGPTPEGYVLPDTTTITIRKKA